MPPTGTSPRRKLPFLNTTDAPTIHEAQQALTTALDNDVEGGEGKESERPAAKLRGRVWVVSGETGANEVKNGLIYWDNGSTWILLNPTKAAAPVNLAWGYIGQTGTITAGSGDFTVTKGGQGEYTIVWSKERASASYATVVTPLTFDRHAITAIATAAHVPIGIYNASGLVDSAFSFVTLAGG